MQNKQRGLTLIELMVAITIGILLLLGTASMFMSNKRSYKFQEEMGRLQENARYAMDLLISDIRVSGFYGCNRELGNILSHIKVDAADPVSALGQFALFDSDQILLHDLSLEGSESAGAWQPSATGAPGDIVAGTDAITVRYAQEVTGAPRLSNDRTAPRGTFFEQIVDPDTDPAYAPDDPDDDYNLPVEDGEGFLNNADNNGDGDPDKFGKIVFISNCSAGDIFQITNDPENGTENDTSDDFLAHELNTADPEPGNMDVSDLKPQMNLQPGELAGSYFGYMDEDKDDPNDGTAFYVYTARRYYIGDGAKGPGLFVMDQSNPNGVELVEGVENMQILYGIDEDGPDDTVCRECPLYTPTAYVNATGVAGAAGTATNPWGRVVSVRIALLLRTADEDFSEEVDGNQYDLLGTVVGPFNDNRKRRVFTTTILLRNRAYYAGEES